MLSRPADLVRIEEELRQAFNGMPGRFRPFAEYFPNTDRIEVHTKDCSTLEETPDHCAPLVLIKDLYRGGYVGFAITFAVPYCAENGLVSDGMVSLGNVLDTIERKIPGMKGPCAIARRIVMKHDFSMVALTAS